MNDESWGAAPEIWLTVNGQLSATAVAADMDTVNIDEIIHLELRGSAPPVHIPNASFMS